MSAPAQTILRPSILNGPATASGLRVSLPYLAFSKSVNPGQVLEVRIRAQRLPGLIP